jgi:hypothetical protein
MMMPGLKNSMLAAALAVGFLSQDSAQAAPTQTVLRYKDLSASASFHGSDECSSTDVYISGFTNVSSSRGGPRTSTDGVYASYNTFNWCTGEYTYGFGFTEDASVTGTPRHVDVRATVPIEEYSSEGGPVLRTMTVNLSFDANGDYTSHGVNNYTYSTPFERGHYRWVGRSTSADVSGTVTLDGMDLLATTTVRDATIFTSNSGSLTIYRR